MNEEPLDFSWATYKDPDKVENYLKEVDTRKLAQKDNESRRSTIILNKNINQKSVQNVKPIKKKQSVFYKKRKEIITALSIAGASLLVINIMNAKVKKLSASDNEKDILETAIETTSPAEKEVAISLPSEDSYEEVKVSTPIFDVGTNKYSSEAEYKMEVENKEDHSELLNKKDNKVYSDVCIDVPEKAANYLTQDVYDMVINNFGEYIDKYSKMYGVDPNVVAGLIMVESPDYDINNDYDYHKIGLGQYKGEYFDNDTFKTYNYVYGDMESYTVHVENLYANPEEQIKMICITMATSAKSYDYNLVATLEHHNKGCGSVSKSLEAIMEEKGYASKEEVLKYEDQNEIIKHMPDLGDPRYSYKIAYCANECLKNNAFGNENELVFKDHKNNVDHVIKDMREIIDYLEK